MKKGLFLFLVLLLTASGAYSQEANTIITELMGTVPKILILNSDMSNVENIDLVNANSAYLGRILVYTNAVSTVSIVISSQNSGVLVGQTRGNTDTYPYLLGFGTADQIDLKNEFRMTYSSTVAGYTAEFPVKITYTKVMDLDIPVSADTYSDVVTIRVIII
ncbi:MAG TPA: hypothetical protein PKJ53_04500 [Spirochaetales bacterium]|nr:hypothetical protein [Spirochaetales bacterium]